jgi:hypothetical protein
MTTHGVKQYEITLKYGSCHHQDPSQLANSLEAVLIDKTEYQGNLIGKDDCVFFVTGEGDQIRSAVKHAIGDLGISSRAIAIREVKHTRLRRKPKQFDVFAVPLSNGRFGYTQFLGTCPVQFADLVRILPVVTDKVASLQAENVVKMDNIRPVYTIISVGLRKFGWVWVANVPVPFETPKFRHSNQAVALDVPGVYTDWQIWSGDAGWRFVGNLSESEKHLEFLTTWSPWSIAERIVNRKTKYDLIL